jgi:hypothetical protein
MTYRFRPLSVGLCALVVGCSGSANPVGPSAALVTPVTASPGVGVRTNGGWSIERVAEGGSGGGQVCGPDVPVGECPGEVRLVAGDAHLTGGTRFVPGATSQLDFVSNGSFYMVGYGHFTGGTVRLSVANGLGEVSLNLVAEPNATPLQLSGTGTAVQTQSACQFGRANLVTQVVLRLPRLGKTEISDSHQVECAP